MSTTTEEATPPSFSDRLAIGAKKPSSKNDLFPEIIEIKISNEVNEQNSVHASGSKAST